MSIGKWIVIAFVLFASFIATLVTVCMKQDISLVAKDYYKEELDYQDQIERLNNASLLAVKPTIKVVAQHLKIEFNQFKNIEKGELKIFCPSNAKMDRNYQLNSTEDSVQYFKLHDLQKGMYRAKFRWNMNGKEFYQEEIIYL